MAPDVPLRSGAWILRSRTDAQRGRIPGAEGNQDTFDGLQYAVGMERTVGAFHKNNQVFWRVDSVEMIEPHRFLVAFRSAAMSAAMFPAGFPAVLSTGQHPHKECLHSGRLLEAVCRCWNNRRVHRLSDIFHGLPDSAPAF